MERDGVAAVAGVAACLALIAAVFGPYLLGIGDTPGTTAAAYYGSGPFGLYAVAFLALLSVVAFLAGTRGSADPGVAAGVATVLGTGVLAGAGLWALAVNPAVLNSFPPGYSWLTYHRWAVVAVAAVVPVCALAYARAVL